LTLSAIHLKIEAPTGEVTPGRGFYQLEEDSLYVQVGGFGRGHAFFSYLESDRIRFDIDKSGRLILIEVTLPRRQWTVDPHLAAPTIAEPADIRWLDFRERIPDPELITDPRRTSLLVRFSPHAAPNWYHLAEHVFLRADQDNRLAAVMVTGIEDDLAGQQIAAYRHKVNRKLSKAHRGDSHRSVSD
jgi:hypothetical protein